MAVRYGFFEETARGFEPLPFAASAWSPTMVNGPAVCGLLARTLERQHGSPGFLPARLTVDLFRPTLAKPLTVVTELVREGRRIRVADAALMQDGVDVARATVVFLERSAQPPGQLWTRAEVPRPPSVPVATEPTRPLWGSDAHAEGWSPEIGEHQNDSRKRMWQAPMRVIEGEPPSPFVGAVVIGEATSLMTNWGSAGIGFINTDMTLALARLPVGSEVGVEADSHLSTDGVAVGSATLFDRTGPFGTCVVTALSNARRQVDFTNGDIIQAKAGIQ
ncbi:thioesterase family protein [Nocardia sp. XZ_19_369]|uniref:thioesterase family protein n=1 Tax=Nocardia sp. XZ_19_369 TaxID=2769487 RepID=UPI0027D24AC5|nr:thioesterase family protein [Nocardia sp. XZ_19_369]